MTMYMPPIARKKRVAEHANPDTFRVMGHEALEEHIKYEPQDYRSSFEPPTPQESLFPDIPCRRTRVLPRAMPDYRKNNRQPGHCGYLTSDVHLLNAPICNVFTKETQAEQHLWWPSRTNPGKLDPGDHTLDTVYRGDYLYTKQLAQPPSSRHTANPHKEPTKGIEGHLALTTDPLVSPVSFLPTGKVYRENISYEHQYDCRRDPNYPVRAKRHGAFVYPKVTNTSLITESMSEKNLNQSSSSAPATQRRSSANMNQSLPSSRRESGSANEPLPFSPSERRESGSANQPLPSSPAQRRESVSQPYPSPPRQRRESGTSNPPLASPPGPRWASASANKPLSSPPAQRRTSGSVKKADSPKMMATGSSPIEWYIPPAESPKQAQMQTGSSPIDLYLPNENRSNNNLSVPHLCLDGCGNHSTKPSSRKPTIYHGTPQTAREAQIPQSTREAQIPQSAREARIPTINPVYNAWARDSESGDSMQIPEAWQESTREYDHEPAPETQREEKTARYTKGNESTREYDHETVPETQRVKKVVQYPKGKESMREYDHEHVPETQRSEKTVRYYPKGRDGCRVTNMDSIKGHVNIVTTKATMGEENLWYRSLPNPGTLEPGEHTINTAYRETYRYDKDKAPPPSNRFSATPRRTVAKGIAPHNCLRPKKLVKEKKSYEHNYDCRHPNNYPIRGKRVGCFIWEDMGPEESEKFIDHHTKLNQESQTRLNQQTAVKSSSSGNVVEWRRHRVRPESAKY